MGAFATGMGSTDVGIAMALGHTWFRVPQSWKVTVAGEFPRGVYSKDFFLHFLGEVKADGATYRSLEFTGPAMESLSMDARATVANFAVESGAKAGIFPSDDVTRAYLEERGRGDKFVEVRADDDAEYERKLDFDVTDLEPQLACPHFPDNVSPVSEVEPVKVQQVFLGTSTNGRLEDFHVAASILKGRRAAPGTRLLVTPGSRDVLMRGMADGTFQTLVEAGGVVTGPGCGACVGVHEGVLADGEVCVATQNRNFKGRMGNPNASIYLASPATAAATAVEGVITDPRKYL
jgi:3-isopropylmalate/(R)-2-methylmalate dehydratase large subunit